MLGTGLSEASHHEESLAVQEAELAMERRLGALEEDVLSVQGNIACAYEKLGRNEDALRLRRIVYSGQLKINGEEHMRTTCEARAPHSPPAKRRRRRRRRRVCNGSNIATI